MFAITNPTTKPHFFLNIQFSIKRLFDIFFSILLLIILSEVLLFISLIVKITSPGPILFRQKRLGQNEKFFTMLKFRSMYASGVGQEFDKTNQKLNKSINDKRVTTFGRFIRRTSLDELPQLINILKGDMSFVGPRPLIPEMLEHLPSFRQLRSTFKPGLTGLWQVRDRMNNTKAEYMIKYDLDYVSKYSLLLDIRIIFLTIPAVIKGGGAI